MSTHSTDGRPWAKLSELKPSDKLVCDGGFDCMAEGEIKVIKQADDGSLYVDCSSGGHTLEGQLSDENLDSLVGFWRNS